MFSWSRLIKDCVSLSYAVFQDILNNLDSCDLADDDLMLDADFPEDGSLHSGTSERADITDTCKVK